MTTMTPHQLAMQIVINADDYFYGNRTYTAYHGVSDNLWREAEKANIVDAVDEALNQMQWRRFQISDLKSANRFR